MIKSEKKLNDLAILLKKENNVIISKAIELLREEQPFEGAIGLLTAFYDKTDDSSVRKIIEEFMNDLKDQSVCIEVMNEIRKQWKTETTTMLVASCWQSGLNYSDFSLDIAKVFLKGDYTTAIECITVIEESIYTLSRESKDEIIKYIKESHLSATNYKNDLTLELLTILGR
jgi:hypothetical protein